MLKIAACDDDAKTLDALGALIREYAGTRPELDAALARFSSGEALLKAAARETADIYLLDILMPGVNGIETGAAIRQKNADAAILYLTGTPDYALDSYRVKAQGYLLKPVGREALFTALDDAVQRLRQERACRLLVHTKEGVAAAPFHELFYLEYYKHRIICHLSGGRTLESALQRQPFDALAAPLLRDGRFVRTAAAYIVNMQHVRRLHNAVFTLSDGARLPVTRAYAGAKRVYVDYLLKRGLEP